MFETSEDPPLPLPSDPLDLPDVNRHLTPRQRAGEAKKRQSRQALVEALRRLSPFEGLMAEAGAPTVEAIAREAGLSAKTFYSHFDDYTDLQYATYNSILWEKSHDALSRLRAGERPLAILDGYADSLATVLYAAKRIPRPDWDRPGMTATLLIRAAQLEGSLRRDVAAEWIAPLRLAGLGVHYENAEADRNRWRTAVEGVGFVGGPRQLGRARKRIEVRAGTYGDAKIVAEYDSKVWEATDSTASTYHHYRRGIISREERDAKLIEIGLDMVYLLSHDIFLRARLIEVGGGS